VEGISELRRILQAAKGKMRWPLYIRQMKQVLKTNAPGFDERQYGFPGLVDLLRAAQKDGLVRLERDRQGAVRLFQGQALQSAPGTEVTTGYAAGIEGDTRVEEAVASSPVDIEPAVPLDVVDTTAQALGTGQRGARRTRGGASRKLQPVDVQPLWENIDAVAAPARGGRKPARAAKPKAEKPLKADKAEKSKVERRRTPRKPRSAEAADQVRLKT
jgi:hypothetical protein